MVSLKSVQISPLKAHYKFICGHSISAYLKEGFAQRMDLSQAHKDIDYYRRSTQLALTEKRRATFWTLVLWDDEAR